MPTIGPLLRSALDLVENATSTFEASAAAAHLGGGDGNALPVFAQLPQITVQQGESWGTYRARVEKRLRPLRDRITQTMGVAVEHLVAANALQLSATPDQIRYLTSLEELQFVELDPLVQVTSMDDVARDIDLPAIRAKHPSRDGSGVRVAVIDSGVDAAHPFLKVADAVSTCGESVDLPGDHGTHCAGSICSQDAVYGGVAPGVTLLNVKVLRRNGTGQPSFITKGIDEALDRDAEVLSMSLGFNHLPSWSANGHGWACPQGACQLCIAVDNAVRLDGVIAVVAAGNEHDRAEALRSWGYGHAFDTELGCPGQAREALTVGALTKSTFLPASFSSRGPTAWGIDKPDLVAPGVNITSTIPVPRDPGGNPVPNPHRSTLFGRKSGTSMATPIVAGAVALIIEEAKSMGHAWSPTTVRQALLTTGVVSMSLPANVAGHGRLLLTNL
jgi:serine protease AprX